LFLSSPQLSQRQRYAQILTGEWCNNAREDLLHGVDHIISAADWRGHALVDIGDQTRSSREEQQDPVEIVKVFLQRCDKDDQVIRIQRGAMGDGRT
jgi:hypothetical protein